jgi:cold shock CspA family protein
MRGSALGYSYKESLTLIMSDTRFKGKITKLGPTGWGFINSHEIPFTRIFFHWSKLNHNTLNFKDLKIGMEVEFTSKYYESTENKQGGHHAVDIEVCQPSENDIK